MAACSPLTCQADSVIESYNQSAFSLETLYIAAYLEKLGALGPDGVIVADPGVFITARELMPHIPLHLSTQANSTNLGILYGFLL